MGKKRFFSAAGRRAGIILAGLGTLSLLACAGRLPKKPQPVPPTTAVPTVCQTEPMSTEALVVSTQPQQEKTVNFLFIGKDLLPGEKTARSDSILLCTFRSQDHTLILTSFLRDLYVPIPGYGKNRLNAAYAFGGGKLLKKTLMENFEIPIDGTMEVDFNRFAEIVDLLGGVEIELRRDETKLINEETGSGLSSGWQNLNGAQALSYCRIRRLDADGDFSRTQRQRTVMKALLDKYKDAGLLTTLSLMRKIIPMLSTDLDSADLFNYAITLYPMVGGMDMIMQCIPQEGHYQDQTIDGMKVLAADMDAARSLLRETVGA